MRITSRWKMFSIIRLRTVTNYFSVAGGRVKFVRAIICLRRCSEAGIFVAVLTIPHRQRYCKYFARLLSPLRWKKQFLWFRFARITKKFLRTKYFGRDQGLSFVARPIKEKFYFRNDYGRNLRVIQLKSRLDIPQWNKMEMRHLT